MATSYTPRAKFRKPAHGDRGWDVPLNENCDVEEGINAIGGLMVSPREMPSASLYVTVGDGKFILTNGQMASYAGEDIAVTANATSYLWLDESAVLHAGTAYPTGAILRLARVIAGATTITGIQDHRMPYRTAEVLVAAGLFYGGPATGAAAAPTFRAVVNTDIPKTLDHTWVSDFIATVETVRLDQMAHPTAPIDFNGQRGINAADPVDPQDVATKAFVLSTAGGYGERILARVATAAVLPSCTYANGTAGVGATLTANANGLLAVDGVNMAAGYLVLVTKQAGANKPQNGLYTVTNPGDPYTPWELTRYGAMDQAGEFSGWLVPVGPDGATLHDTLWLCDNEGAITVGTTDINFVNLCGLSAVECTDGSLDVTTAAGVANITIDTSHANTWTALQTFDAGFAASGRVSFPAHTTAWQQFTASGSGPASVTIDWSLGDKWYGRLASGVNNITYINAPAAGDGQVLLLRLQQPAAGVAGTVGSWPSGTKWPGGAAPTLSTANDAVDLLTVSLDPTATRYETVYSGGNMS